MHSKGNTFRHVRLVRRQAGAPGAAGAIVDELDVLDADADGPRRSGAPGCWRPWSGVGRRAAPHPTGGGNDARLDSRRPGRTRRPHTCARLRFLGTPEGARVPANRAPSSTRGRRTRPSAAPARVTHRSRTGAVRAPQVLLHHNRAGCRALPAVRRMQARGRRGMSLARGTGAPLPRRGASGGARGPGGVTELATLVATRRRSALAAASSPGPLTAPRSSTACPTTSRRSGATPTPCSGRRASRSCSSALTASGRPRSGSSSPSHASDSAAELLGLPVAPADGPGALHRRRPAHARPRARCGGWSTPTTPATTTSSRTSRRLARAPAVHARRRPTRPRRPRRRPRRIGPRDRLAQGRAARPREGRDRQPRQHRLPGARRVRTRTARPPPPAQRENGGAKPKRLADVYGSRWLTAGMGSVLLLWGEPGDLVVEVRHLKQPVRGGRPVRDRPRPRYRPLNRRHGRRPRDPPRDGLDRAHRPRRRDPHLREHQPEGTRSRRHDASSRHSSARTSHAPRRRRRHRPLLPPRKARMRAVTHRDPTRDMTETSRTLTNGSTMRHGTPHAPSRIVRSRGPYREKAARDRDGGHAVSRTPPAGGVHDAPPDHGHSRPRGERNVHDEARTGRRP